MDQTDFDVRPFLTRMADGRLGVDPSFWSAVCHAYGPADDMPALLATAAGGDADAAEWAMRLLWSSAWHQGTVYSAAALATPFLLDAAMDPAVHDRPRMLLMAAAAARRYRFQNYGRADLLGVAYTEPRYDTFGQRIDCTNEAARTVIASRASAVVALLDDPDARLRTMAAYTLAAAAPDSSDIAPALRTRLADDPWATQP